MTATKNSNIEWIGEIPADWNVERGKFYFTNNKYVPGIRSSQYDRLALSLKGVVNRPKEDADGLQPKDFNTYQLLRENELVFKLIDLQNVSTSRVGLSHATGLVSPAYIVLHAGDKILPEYAEKYYLMMWYREIFNALGDNGVRSNLGVSDLLNVPILVPRIEVQKSIANFLDQKCSEIDSLSSEIQSQIDVLEQYKKSIITKAVTKGLNPDVEMKDSGIEWIGEIPTKWELVKFKSICKPKSILNSGDRELLSVYLNRGVIRYADSSNMQVHKPSESLDNYQNVDVGNLVMNNQQAWRGSVGVSSFYGIISPAYFIYELSKTCIPEYMNYVFRDTIMVQQYEYSSKGVGTIQRNISQQWLKQSLVILPPRDEQKKIADFLDNKCVEIEGLIANKKAQLEILAEYKKSLIYEYVTGKKEVV